MQNEHDYLFKIILIGDSGVGKTCLMQRYTDNIYKENNSATIGVDFKIKTINIDNKKVKLQVWDTAGQERFKSIVNNYYRGANGVFIVFDMTNKDSFIHSSRWLKEFEEKRSRTNAEIILLGNKVDEKDKIKISRTEIKNFCREHNLKMSNFYEVSAKTDYQVEEAFVNMTKTLIKRFGSKAINRAIKNSLDFRDRNTRGCCG
ncbi:hypothetical protein NUSPORA_00269 [Nucleospora cyclopteri]